MGLHPRRQEAVHQRDEEQRDKTDDPSTRGGLKREARCPERCTPPRLAASARHREHSKQQGQKNVKVAVPGPHGACHVYGR